MLRRTFNNLYQKLYLNSPHSLSILIIFSLPKKLLYVLLCLCPHIRMPVQCYSIVGVHGEFPSLQQLISSTHATTTNTTNLIPEARWGMLYDRYKAIPIDVLFHE